MEIKKISKEELKEGLSLELVNSIDLKQHSPSDFVQLQAGDEPVKLMKCAAGYWVVYAPGQYLKDKDNKLMVFPERICQIGRARYLLNHLKTEKDRKVKELINYWTSEIKVRIEKLRHTIDTNGRTSLDFLLPIIAPGKSTEIIELRTRNCTELKDSLEMVEGMLGENRIVELLDVFNIKKFDTPMMQASFDNKNEMKALVNVFHKKELDKSDGDTLKFYAKIEIEKEYLFLAGI